MAWAVIGAPHAQKAMAAVLGKEESSIDDLDHYDLVDAFNFRTETLCNFARAAEADYRPENAYHNNTHAADVTQTAFTLLQMGGDRYSGGTLDIFSTLVAAVCHDMGHPGKNNSYLINSKSPTALLYNDVSVLESMHASRAFRLLLGSAREDDVNITARLSPSQFASFRSNFIKSVLATDMSKHFKSLAKLRAEVNSIGISDPGKFFHGDHSSISHPMLFMLHCADISNPAKPDPICIEWTDRCLGEFFAQGDAERAEGLPVSPMCDRNTTDRNDSQIGFIKFIIMPTYELLSELIPESSLSILPILKENLKYWEDRKASGEK
jgi:hypothetical protein